jgi:hypothetical protein
MDLAQRALKSLGILAVVHTELGIAVRELTGVMTEMLLP